VKEQTGEGGRKYRFIQSVDLRVILLAITLRLVQFRIGQLLRKLLKKGSYLMIKLWYCYSLSLFRIRLCPTKPVHLQCCIHQNLVIQVLQEV